MMTMSKTLRLAIIATLALASSVLGIMSYKILFPEEVKQAEPAPPPKRRLVRALPLPPPVERPAPEEPPSVRIITLKQGGKEGSSFIITKCWNFVCE
jgi:hypothetical protein